MKINEKAFNSTEIYDQRYAYFHEFRSGQDKGILHGYSVVPAKQLDILCRDSFQMLSAVFSASHEIWVNQGHSAVPVMQL